MMEGTVKWYSEKKGYGFIETENDGDIFMHSRSIKDHGFFFVAEIRQSHIWNKGDPSRATGCQRPNRKIISLGTNLKTLIYFKKDLKY